jgi:hypothetical protein
MNMKLKLSLITCAIAVLSGCGGGGDGGGGTPVVNTAEGFWEGTSSNGATVSIAILENGEAWGGAIVGNTLVSAIAGTANGSGTSFSASGSEFAFTSNSVARGTYTGSVTQKQRIQATGSSGNTIDLAYDANYDRGVTAAEIAGSYTLSGRTALYSITNLTFTVGANGAFTIVDGGCTTTGTVTPRASGKAIVDVRATGTGPCVLGNGVSLSGIAVLNKTRTPNTLSVIALNGGKTDGLVLIGRKN